MTNRRRFLKAAAGAGAAVVTAGFGRLDARGQTPASPAKRREVLVGRKRGEVGDIHGPFLIPGESAVRKDTPLARNVTNTSNGTLVLGPARIRALDDFGIDVQVLSHQGGWWYGLGRDPARQLITIQNEKLAEWCTAHPDRFAGLAS